MKTDIEGGGITSHKKRWCNWLRIMPLMGFDLSSEESLDSTIEGWL